MVAIACYCTACALWLASDMVAIPPPPLETVLFYVGLHLVLGVLTAQPWAAWACLAPVVLPFVPGLVATEPDVPGWGWATAVSVSALLLTPAGAALVLAGGAARQRLRGRSRSA